jgi:UDP-N-acetylglucosamine:LPS N-acetylglucosamine transferase
MGRILFTWELGGALGHLASFRPLAKRLHQLGHEIHLAANNVSAAARILLDIPVTLHPIPVWRPRHAGSISAVHTYAHVLHNIGYRDPNKLLAHLRAWQILLREITPHVLVCEASPTALLAARGSGIASVHVGTGYGIPPPSYPLADLHFWKPAHPDTMRSDEDLLTENINAALSALGGSVLSRLHDLFETELTALWTVKDLDHYRGRSTDSYIGSIAHLAGEQPPWPTAAGPRVFAYLKPFPELPKLLQQLKRRSASALIYGPSLPPDIAARFQCDNIHFMQTPADISYISRSATLAITNAGHTLSLEMLLAGIPLLCFPLLLEQHVLARNVDALGAGRYCSPWRSDRIGSALDALLDDSSYAQAAQCFASRYSNLSAPHQATLLAARISALVN